LAAGENISVVLIMRFIPGSKDSRVTNNHLFEYCVLTADIYIICCYVTGNEEK
jgi:hypothetical protein